jgi:hypothetical protein
MELLEHQEDPEELDSLEVSLEDSLEVLDSLEDPKEVLLDHQDPVSMRSIDHCLFIII